MTSKLYSIALASIVIWIEVASQNAFALDTVKLKSGDIFRGHIVEMKMNQFIQLRLKDESEKRLKWSLIDKIEKEETREPANEEGLNRESSSKLEHSSLISKRDQEKRPYIRESQELDSFRNEFSISNSTGVYAAQGSVSSLNIAVGYATRVVEGLQLGVETSFSSVDTTVSSTVTANAFRWVIQPGISYSFPISRAAPSDYRTSIFLYFSPGIAIISASISNNLTGAKTSVGSNPFIAQLGLGFRTKLTENLLYRPSLFVLATVDGTPVFGINFISFSYVN